MKLARIMPEVPTTLKPIKHNKAWTVDSVVLIRTITRLTQNSIVLVLEEIEHRDQNWRCFKVIAPSGEIGWMFDNEIEFLE